MVRDMTVGQINKLSKRKCTLNNHKMGITPHKFKMRKALNKFFKIVSTSDDRKADHMFPRLSVSLSVLWCAMASRTKFRNGLFR